MNKDDRDFMIKMVRRIDDMRDDLKKHVEECAKSSPDKVAEVKPPVMAAAIGGTFQEGHVEDVTSPKHGFIKIEFCKHFPKEFEAPLVNAVTQVLAILKVQMGLFKPDGEIKR